MLATIDDLAGGRLILGAGVGWLRDEFDALVLPPEVFEHRGRHLPAAGRDPSELAVALIDGITFTDRRSRPPGGRHRLAEDPTLDGALKALERVAPLRRGDGSITPPRVTAP